MLYSVPYYRTDGTWGEYYVFTHKPPMGATPVLIPKQEASHAERDVQKVA